MIKFFLSKFYNQIMFAPFIYETLKTNLKKKGLTKTWQELLANYIHQEMLKGKKHLAYLLAELPNPNYSNEIDLSILTFGEIAELYEFSLSLSDAKGRKTSGQYFTPDDIAKLLALKSKQHFLKPNAIWCDPAVGIGNLSYPLIQQQPEPEDFLQHRMVFFDTDKTALLIARILLTVTFQNKITNLFHQLESRFIHANFLTEQDFTGKPLPQFDYALLNPPYAQMLQSDTIFKNQNFLTKPAGDLYTLFLEKLLLNQHLLGFVALTPQSFTHAKKFLSLRKLLLQQAFHVTIYNFDNVPDNIFNQKKFGSFNSNQANSTRAAITLVHLKSYDDLKKNHPTKLRITPLLRWRRQERAKFLQKIDEFLTSIPKPNHDIFPKLTPQLLKLYNEQQSWQNFKNLLSDSPTSYILYLPSTPRYFISALQKLPKRTSIKKLFFLNQTAKIQAYLLLNSSFAYWWWRLVDGGMSISKKTLLTMPLPPTISPNKKLYNKLLLSEKNNRVFKKNAGKNNENVKHKKNLINDLNYWLLPKYANDLIKLHQNSNLSEKINI